MGIWAPGATITLYFALTIGYYCPETIEVMQMVSVNSSSVALLAFLIASYLCGVILHEIGKIIKSVHFSLTKKTLSIETYRRLCEKNNDEPSKSRKQNRIVFWMPYHRECKQLFFDIQDIMLHYYDESLTIYDAIQTLRERKEDLSRVNKTRSLHGYARSVCLGSAIHLIALIPLGIEIHRILTGLVITDLLLIALFWNRSCRYYFAWVKKAVIQYDDSIRRFAKS